MRSLFVQMVLGSTRSLVLIVAAMLALGVGIGASLGIASVFASHDDPDTIHACVNQRSGNTRVLAGGEAPDCKGNETLVEWQSAAGLDALAEEVAQLEEDLTGRVGDLEDDVTALEAENVALKGRIDELEGEVADLEAANTALGERVADLEETSGTLTTSVSELEEQVPGCLTTEGDDAVFKGCNVHVRNGEDSTDTTNGAGNLIIGYNEEPLFGMNRSGSHNLVVGARHSYSSYGGFVAGFDNTVSGPYSTVSGGRDNEASVGLSSVSGGIQNKAQQTGASVSGGFSNKATGQYSSVSGGESNTASGFRATVGGGYVNEASGSRATVSGGGNNKATELGATIGGGVGLTADGFNEWVAGND